MAKWFKKTWWKLTYNNFVFEYDTAYELGKMVKESVCKMPNPYEPGNADFDDFVSGLNSGHRYLRQFSDY